MREMFMESSLYFSGIVLVVLAGIAAVAIVAIVAIVFKALFSGTANKEGVELSVGRVAPSIDHDDLSEDHKLA
jgi:hypothetical protein